MCQQVVIESINPETNAVHRQHLTIHIESDSVTIQLNNGIKGSCGRTAAQIKINSEGFVGASLWNKPKEPNMSLILVDPTKPRE